MAADVLAPGFWEIGSYKHNVRRIKDGMDQLEELQDGMDQLEEFAKMARERAEIEAKYGKALQQYSEKWRGHVDRMVPHGAVKTAWTEILTEADALALQHNKVKDRLVEEVVQKLTHYRKENHHPSAFRAPKEIREIDEAFEKAQRQWKKLFDKMEASKKIYYSSCRQEKSAAVNLNNCQADSSISQDGTQKFRDRHEKSKEEKQKTRVNYEKMLGEISQYRTPYMESMGFVFEKCQQLEMKRSKFFIEIMTSSQQVLVDLIRNNRFNALHQQIEGVLGTLNNDVLLGDLEQWSAVNGVKAHCDWPAFEDYTPEMRTIANKSAPSRSVEAGGVVLTRQIIKNDDVASNPGPASSAHSEKSSSDSDTNTFDSRKTDKKSKDKQWNERPVIDSPPPSNDTPDSAKYGDEFDDITSYVAKSNAKVLYDYDPIESDEIKLKKGEVIEVISEPDSLGWCTGRRNGHVGLFPASYVQVI